MERANAVQSHTAGPWSASAPYGALERYYIMVGGHTVVAELPGFTKDSSYVISNDRERMANARLIAAAPELLEALRFAEWYIGEQKSALRDHETLKEYQKIVSAIQKATGG